MKKVLFCVAVVFGMVLAGAAFAADVGHTGGVIVPPVVTPPSAVTAAVGGESFKLGDTPAVTQAQKEALEKKYGASVSVLNLPKMTADKAGTFVFGVSVERFSGVALSSCYFFLNRSEVAAKAAAAVTVPKGGYKYLNAKGEAINTVPADGKLFVAVDVPAAGTYEPVMAVESSSKKKDSSSGCDAGFSVATLLSLGALFFLKKRK